MVKYRFDLYRAGVKQAELVDVSDIQYGYKRNAFTNCRFRHNGNKLDPALQAVLTKGSEIRIFRKGKEETDLRLVYAGEIQTTPRTVTNLGQKLLDIQVEAWGNVFFKTRFTSKSFVAIEEEDIAWGIVDDTQTDTFSATYTASQVDWGITQGTLEVTNNTRTRSSYDDDEILKVLQQLADVRDTGGNPQRIRGFRLSPDLTDSRYHFFGWFANYGEDRNVTYINPAINDMTLVETIKGLSNRVTATGKNGIKQTAASTDQDNLDLFKLRRSFISRTNVSDTTELLENAQEELDKRVAPPDVFSFNPIINDPFTGLYRVGDNINVEFKDSDDFIDINLQLRVYSIDISFDSLGKERTRVKVAAAKPVTLDTTTEEKLVDVIKVQSDRLTELEKTVT